MSESLRQYFLKPLSEEILAHSSHVLLNTLFAVSVCQVQCGVFVCLFVNTTLVVEDDLQQAVWRTILRGPRPSAKRSRTTPAAPGPCEGVEAVPSDFDDTAPSYPLSREVMVARAQSSGEAPHSVRHLGEDDEASTTIKAALQKAEVQAQERPMSKQIKSTQLYNGRKEKRVEQACQAVIQARKRSTKLSSRRRSWLMGSG